MARGQTVINQGKICRQINPKTKSNFLAWCMLFHLRTIKLTVPNDKGRLGTWHKCSGRTLDKLWSVQKEIIERFFRRRSSVDNYWPEDWKKYWNQTRSWNSWDGTREKESGRYREESKAINRKKCGCEWSKKIKQVWTGTELIDLMLMLIKSFELKIVLMS